MRLVETYYVPLVTSFWMIGVPLVFAFLAGAGAGTMLNGVARIAGSFWSIYGGVSMILGFLLLGWVLFKAWRTRPRELHG